MRLRLAQPGDEVGVAGVHVRSWRVAYRGLLPDEYLDGLRPEDRARRYTFGDTDADQPATIVATERQTISGFATTGPSQDDGRAESGELLALYVDPNRWGLGIGRTLLQAARARLARQGFETVGLWLLVGNQRAARFYRIDGWASDGSRRHDEVCGVTIENIRYSRPLP